MAWTDKPTDAQIGRILTRLNEAGFALEPLNSNQIQEHLNRQEASEMITALYQGLGDRKTQEIVYNQLKHLCQSVESTEQK